MLAASRCLRVSANPFVADPALRTAPDPKQWDVNKPKAGTREDLTVAFPTPMNYPLLERMLQVSNVHGGVPGQVRIDKAETEWRFTPRDAWAAGDYKLIADTGLEDLAGNSIAQPFDIDVFHRVTEHIATKTVAVPFSIR